MTETGSNTIESPPAVVADAAVSIGELNTILHPFPLPIKVLTRAIEAYKEFPYLEKMEIFGLGETLYLENTPFPYPRGIYLILFFPPIMKDMLTDIKFMDEIIRDIDKEAGIIRGRNEGLIPQQNTDSESQFLAAIVQSALQDIIYIETPDKDLTFDRIDMPKTIQDIILLPGNWQTDVEYSNIVELIGHASLKPKIVYERK